MPLISAEQRKNLPVHRRISWREFYGSITRHKMYPVFQREMLLNHVGADGEIEYQGHIIEHVTNEGDKKNPSYLKYEVIYDAEFVAECLYEQFQNLGLISNQKVNLKLWDKWLNHESGVIANYAATEGVRKQEEEDRIRAQALVDTVGETVEFWMDSFKRAREKNAVESSGVAATETSNGTSKAKKTAKV